MLLVVCLWFISPLDWLSCFGHLTLCSMVSVCTDSHGVYILHRKGHFLCDLYFGCLAEVSRFNLSEELLQLLAIFETPPLVI